MGDIKQSSGKKKKKRHKGRIRKESKKSQEGLRGLAVPLHTVTLENRPTSYFQAPKSMIPHEMTAVFILESSSLPPT